MKKIIVSLVVLLTLSFGNTIDEAKAYYEKKIMYLLLIYLKN